MRPGLGFIATRVPWPLVTGHYLRTFNIVKGLSERFEIHFFGFHAPAVTKSEAQEARAALGQFCASVVTDWVPAEKSLVAASVAAIRAILLGQPFVVEKYFSQAMLARIHESFRAANIALMHGDSLPSAEYLRRFTCPVLLTDHNVEWIRSRRFADAEQNAIRRWFMRWQAAVTRGYERATLERVRDCVVVSTADKEALQELDPSAHLYVVPNGTNTSEPPPPRRSCGIPTALWVGGMDDPYNRLAVEYFLTEVHPRIRARIPEFVWRVVGKSAPPALRMAAAEPNSGVQLAGFVDDLRTEYAGADLVVVPLTAGGGTKLKTLEALAMRRAVVATRIGAEGIDAVHDVHMLVAEDTEAFVRHVIDMVMDPERRERVAEAGRILAVRNYDWAIVNDQMAAAVWSAIANQRGVESPCAA